LNKLARARLQAIETFQKIPGIGCVSPFYGVWLPISFCLTRIVRERTATNLVNAGAASVSDLRLPKYDALLAPTQKVGVLYGEHMTKPIHRAEAEEIAVRSSLHHFFLLHSVLIAIKAFIRDHISCNFEVHLTGA
jgi:hypothetical protein